MGKPKSNSHKRVMLVQVARKALGLDEDTYRAILREHGGTDSASTLDYRGFASVMDRFRELGFVSDLHKASFSPNNRIGMATAAQLALIRDLWSANTDGADEAALDHWLEGHFRISSLRFVSDAKAKKVIAALKAWAARKQARAEREGASA